MPIIGQYLSPHDASLSLSLSDCIFYMPIIGQYLSPHDVSLSLRLSDCIFYMPIIISLDSISLPMMLHCH